MCNKELFLYIIFHMLYCEKFKERELVSKIIEELPYDVIYHIYGYCPRKRIFVDHTMINIKYFVFYMIIVNGISYGMGVFVTKQLNFFLLNLMIGYLLLSVVSGFFIFVHIVFKKCVE